MGTRHRVTGQLNSSPRGYVLRVDDGGVWALDAPLTVEQHLGHRVIVEGTRVGFDRLEVDWVSAEPD